MKNINIKKLKKLLTIYKFCCDYHSGQWSRGYRLICRIAIKIKRMGFVIPDHINIDNNLYCNLAKKYQDKI